ncbi:MAG: segregation and condensation protein A [Spirochaetia bacterium]
MNITSSDSQKFQAGAFEGPLDLLLFLIKRSEVSIYDIPIHEITEQYLAYLDYAAKIDLDNITEFYLMATTLIYIKSRMLLPVEMNMDDEMDDPRQELVDRLIEYQKIKKLTELMTEKNQDSEWVVQRNKDQRSLPFPEDENLWDELDVWELLKTFSRLISSLSSERIIDLTEEVTINEKLTLINELLETKKYFMFTDLLTKKGAVLDVVCAFIAVLESVKARRIRILQNRMFGDIRIEGKEPSDTIQPEET